MSDIGKAADHLKANGIEAFEGSNILVIPCDGPDYIVGLVSRVKKLLSEINYEKSWQIDPYYYERHKNSVDELA